jgi:hypothetical protein
MTEETLQRECQRRAIHNVYNYSVLSGIGAAALLTGQWWLLAVGAGVEVLWMLYGPGLPPVRRAVDRALERQSEADTALARDAQLKSLSKESQERCRGLLAKQAEITRLASENATLSGDLLRAEIGKLQRLVDSFIGLAATATRYRAYLNRENVDEVERQRQEYDRQAQAAKGEAADLARKNLEIVLRRLERLREIRGFVERAAGQLDVIENGFRLLGDQIVSMRSPAELSGQLDDLLDGVEAVRETAREADRLLQPEAQ